MADGGDGRTAGTRRDRGGKEREGTAKTPSAPRSGMGDWRAESGMNLE